jgi:hypothetical protein
LIEAPIRGRPVLFKVLGWSTILRNRGSELSPFIVLVALWGILFLQFLTGHRLISFDSLDAFYEAAYFNSQTLRHGHLPWWNPYIYSGYPQIADPQGMMFSPLLMLLMVVVETPGVAWFDFVVLLHLLIGGWGCLALCRSYRLAPVAGLLVAVVYMTGGAASARLQHTPIILAYGYLPWLMYTTRQFLRYPNRTKATSMGLVVGALLTHLVQATFIFGLFIFAYAIATVTAARGDTNSPSSGRLVWGLALAMGVALLIAGLQIAATLAVLPLSTRGAFPFDVVSAAALSPKSFLTIIWPNGYGNLHGTYSGVADPTESMLYVGIIPCCVLLLGLGRALGSAETRIDKFVLLGGLVFAAAYTLGASTPLYKVLYSTVPGMSLFRRPSDATFLFNFCVALLAGFSASSLVSHSTSASQRRAGFAILSIAAAWYFAIALAEWAKKSGGYWPIALLGAIAALFALVVIRRNNTQSMLIVGITLLMVGDMRVFTLPNRLNSSDSDLARFFDAPGAIMQVMKADLVRNPGTLPFRIEATMTTDNLWANGGLVHGLSSTQGYNPLRMRDYGEIFGAQESALTPRPFTPALPSLDSPLFSLAGTRYVVTAAPIEELAAGNVNGHFEKVSTERGLTLWRNKVAYDRLLAPIQGKLVPVGERPTATHFQNVDFNRTLVLYPRDSGEADELLHLIDDCRGKATFSDVSASNNNLEFNVSAEVPSWIAVSDLDFPGWEAFVDERAVHMWRANGLFRALCVPAGKHRLKYSFSVSALLKSLSHRPYAP